MKFHIRATTPPTAAPATAISEPGMMQPAALGTDVVDGPLLLLTLLTLLVVWLVDLPAGGCVVDAALPPLSSPPVPWAVVVVVDEGLLSVVVGDVVMTWPEVSVIVVTAIVVEVDDTEDVDLTKQGR